MGQLHHVIDSINNREDVIDSRDVIARIEQLEAELQDAHEGEGNEPPFPDWLQDMADNPEGTLQEAAEELIELRKLQEQGEQYAPDWQYGEALIRESHFTDYAKQMLEDCGDLPKDLPSYIAIDWDKTAENIKVDYTEIDFDGITYLIR